ncbi:MAG: acetyl-CoA carboxylase biotin carboxylase subunit [Chloroflexi bacterium]|nr:acetyl-CoA carboxylase biotin carboxylase subunit [Chloroflexota bacterium]
MFEKILIANRGEIAVRIIHACRELQIQTIAIYSDADRRALHTRVADAAIQIGGAELRASYLNIEKIIAAAKKTNAQAIHPGYGFLSENADFAQAVRDAGLVFIGPRAESIRAMGDKAAARARMQKNRVPIIPGYHDADDDASLGRAAEKIGYPILVKAAAGGGGKGMRVVAARAEFSDALASARREAHNAFGDARLILEKFIPHARHIEFQILADAHGETIHLFERECSIQRRHQKIIEETPSPLLDEKLRATIGAAAVAAARAVNYENAGTIEFIVDPTTRAFYFLEMNTRLQVEHPITEMTTGVDLVQWQIRIASGEPIAFASQRRAQDSPLQPRGHAIECRVYAEDAANNFLPATGTLLQAIEPRAPGVRVDAGVTRGDAVTVHYDPLLAKVIVHAESRAAAIHKMQNALRDYVLLGVMTNIEFLQAALAHSEFQRGEATTAFIEKNFADWKPRAEIPPPALIAAVLDELRGENDAAESRMTTVDPYNPWQRADGFRIGMAE